MWACTRPLQSVYAAAELVCRGRVVVLARTYNRSDLNLCLQSLGLIILKLGMIKVAVSNGTSKKSVIKLLRFESDKMGFFAFCEKGPFLNLKKSCIINGLSANWRLENAKSPAAMLQENKPQTPHA